jgi:P-type Ca2+ transporter type 2C
LDKRDHRNAFVVVVFLDEIGVSMENNRLWHSLSTQETLDLIHSSSEGLTKNEAAARLEQSGLNELVSGGRVSALSLFIEQFKNIFVIILLLAAIISFFLGHGIESIAITVIVLFAVILGFVQEYRAERAIEALREMAAPTASVIRDGVEVEIPAHDLVPGDVILLRAGDKVPADSRLLESINLQIEESALTGESLPVEKHNRPLEESQLGLGDRKNMVYSGTVVTYGRGKAVVTGTGMQSEFGKITGMLQEVERGKTPLQENLDRVGKVLAKAAFIVVLLIVILGILRGQDVLEMFIFGIALAVAVVPEALPAVVTISLAIGIQRMVKRNALVRRLPTVETLGSTSIICSDKTGTLTKDEMTVRKIFVAGELIDVTGTGYVPEGEFIHHDPKNGRNGSLYSLLRSAALVSDAQLITLEGRWAIKGDPTEGALVVAAAKAGMNKTDLDKTYPRVAEIPFTSETKRMTTLQESDSGRIAHSKGAPEVILDSCTSYLSAEGVRDLDLEARGKVLRTAQEMADNALRVLGVASKPAETVETAEKEMTFLGLVGMIDPPRMEAKESIRICEEAGIHPVMITGDHPLTARAVARDLGLLHEGGRVVTGAELECMSDEDLDREVESIEVYARMSPVHKLRVITAWQNKGQVVAMTGDGVNDAPALKKADIGIAMGITGTDVSKEAADMTLTDDNFASIVAAVEEGRGIFGNIKKYLMYLLSSNIGEIGLMAGATLLGMPLPLTAVQILYVNLATDGLPALALALDPPEDDLMRRRPRDPRRGIFTRPVVSLMVIGGLWSTFINLGIFGWALSSGRSLPEAMTMTFVSLVMIQFFKAYNFRSDRNSVLHKPFQNKWLNLAISWELILLLLVVYLPLLQVPFGTFALPAEDWLIILAASFTVSPILEAAKWMERRGWFGKLD